MRSELMLCLLLGGGIAFGQLNFTQRVVPMRAAGISVTTADFDGDRKLDLATVSVNGTVTVQLGRGDGSFPEGVQVDSGPVPARYVIAPDVNGDGRPDLVVTNALAGQISVMIGRGDGRFFAAASFACGNGPEGITAGDFNGDGRIDIAVPNSFGLIPSQTGTTITALLGRGDGTFARAVASKIVGERPSMLEAGDFNRDGKADLVVTNAGSPDVSVLMSVGDGTFSASALPFPVPQISSRIVVEDLDRDGNLDIALGGANALFTVLGNGDGTFQRPYGGPLDGYHLRAGDFNGDGKIDLAAMSPVYSVAIVLEGNGDGTFGQQQPFALGMRPMDIAAGDFNGDGSLDMVLVQPSSAVLLMLLNSTPRPVVFPNGVVNAASFRPGPLAVAPGEIVTIFGRGMGPSQLVTARLKTPDFLDTTLAGVRVLFDGVAAPLIYVRQDQVSVVVPYAVAGKTSTVMQLVNGSAWAAPMTLRVVPTVPGIFTLAASGSGQVAALNQDGTLNSATNPAAKGSVVTFFATGEGQTDPPGIDGKIASVPLPRPSLPLIVGIGDMGAEIVYAGAAPGLVSGLLQVNARVPLEAPSGARVSLVLLVGDTFSPAGVTLAIE